MKPDATPDPLEEAMTQLNAMPIGNVPSDVLSRTQAAMMHVPHRRLWPALTAAAAMLIVIGAASIWLRTSSALAFSDVFAQVEKTKTLRATIITHEGRGPQRSTLTVSGSRWRMESDSSVLVRDMENRESLQLSVKQKQAYKYSDDARGGNFDLYGLLKSVAAGKTEPIDDYTAPNGKRYTGVEGKGTIQATATMSVPFTLKIWMDPQTKLPVRADMVADPDPRQEHTLFEDIEFDVAVDEKTFSLDVPPGYMLMGVTRQQLKAPMTPEEAKAFTITPNVGIGPVKFNMTRDQVIAAIGKPDFESQGTLHYVSKGFILTMERREKDKVQRIEIHPGSAENYVRNDFTGETSAGIRIGSTIKQIKAAYGEPDALFEGQRPEMLAYKTLNATFNCVNDRVAQMWFNREEPAPKAFEDNSPPPLKLEQLKPQMTADEARSYLVQPDIGVGNVRFGMTRDEVIARWGEPEIVSQVDWLYYPSKGIAIVFDYLGQLWIIGIHNTEKPMSVRHDFLGKTADNIGIGSSEADVLKIFGKPTNEQKGPYGRNISYSKPGLSLLYDKDNRIAAFVLIDAPKFPKESPKPLKPEQLRKPLTAEQAKTDLAITPGVGIGKVRFGMTRDELVRAWGEPEFTWGDRVLYYPSLGLRVDLGRDGVRVAYFAIEQPGNEAMSVLNPFLGKLPGDIGIGSPAAALEAQFGKPDADYREWNDSRVLRFLNSGLKFLLAEDRVVQIEMTAKPGAK